MSEKSAKYVAKMNDRICRLDLDKDEIEVSGMDKDRCRKLLRTLLENE